MYTAIPSQPTNAQAWLAAASAVQDAGGEAYNVVIDIADPLAVAGPDEAILTTVDQFLRGHHVNSRFPVLRIRSFRRACSIGTDPMDFTPLTTACCRG